MNAVGINISKGKSMVTILRPFGEIVSSSADSVKIARYTLDKWHKLKQYGLMDELRNQLKTMNRQFGYYTKLKTAMKNNLISLLDQTFSCANAFFDSPARSDGSQKWVDFVDTYRHAVSGKTLLCLHDCRCQQVSSHLLWTRQRISVRALRRVRKIILNLKKISWPALWWLSFHALIQPI